MPQSRNHNAWRRTRVKHTLRELPEVVVRGDQVRVAQAKYVPNLVGEGSLEIKAIPASDKDLRRCGAEEKGCWGISAIWGEI